MMAFCANDNCNADMIVWVSETFERPLYEQAVAQLYEIGWEFVSVAESTKLLCQECAILFHEEEKSTISEFKTVDLAEFQRQQEAAQKDVEDSDREQNGETL